MIPPRSNDFRCTVEIALVDLRSEPVLVPVDHPRRRREIRVEDSCVELDSKVFQRKVIGVGHHLACATFPLLVDSLLDVLIQFILQTHVEEPSHAYLIRSLDQLNCCSVKGLLHYGCSQPVTYARG